MIRVGLLGCGRIGRIHGHNITALNNAELVALFDPVADAANEVAAHTGAEPRTAEAIINASDIDAVLICTPTSTHYEIIHQCAEAGKAIFCEKPVDLNLERSRQCVAAAERAGVPFMVAFNRRFDPNFAALQSRLRNGEIGEVELVTILSRDPAPPPIDYLKISGGLFQDMMIHDFDMARFLLGEEPVELHAAGSVLVDPDIAGAGDIDTAAVTLKTASGKICQISNSRRASYGYDQRIEVHGSKGMFRAENLLENSVEIATESGFKRAPAQHFFLERYAEAYRAEIRHFIDCLEQDQSIEPGGSDGLRAQALAEAAALSLKQGNVQTLSI